MQIEKNAVVQLHYSIKDEQGNLVEDSRNGDPMLYLHGYRAMMPGIEDALLGKTVGDKIEVTLEPKQAYGERRADSIMRVPIKHLLGVDKRKPKLKPGMIVQINTEEGPKNATLLKVGKFNVDIDANHPYSGLTLSFDLEVIDVKEASEEEIKHRHAHGVGGHQH